MSAALPCSEGGKCDISQPVLFYRCIVAMGLDKKLFPPKRRSSGCCHKHVCCWGHALHCHPCDSIEQEESVVIPCHGASVESVDENLEESSEEETENQSSQEDEESQTDTSHSGTVFPHMSRG